MLGGHEIRNPPALLATTSEDITRPVDVALGHHPVPDGLGRGDAEFGTDIRSILREQGRRRGNGVPGDKFRVATVADGEDPLGDLCRSAC